MTPTFDLRRERVNRGLSQRALADKCGVSLTVIQRLETGATATPANAKRVADFFDVLATDLMPLEPKAAA